MRHQDYARARTAITELRLNGANLEIASHWLSCWHSGKPPKRNSFSGQAIRKHSPALMICQIAQGKMLRCVSGGAILRVALGFDISNKDLLALIPVGEREVRLNYWWQLVEGAVSVTYRLFASKECTSGLFQGVGLPFSDEEVDGTRFFLMHSNWRPTGTDWIAGNVEVDFQNTCKRRMISFKEPVPKDAETVLI